MMAVKKTETETVKVDAVAEVKEKGLELSKKLLDNAFASGNLNDNQINNVKLAIELYNTFKA
jgi:hypothetical protein